MNYKINKLIKPVNVENVKLSKVLRVREICKKKSCSFVRDNGLNGFAVLLEARKPIASM